MNKISALLEKMTEYEAGCAARVHHFFKVYAFAKTIGELEGLNARDQLILEAAAAVHDVGIRPALEQYRSDAGPYQQLLGPPLARKMLAELDFPPDVIDRVCFLVSRHHTYTGIDAPDYRILVEADFIVNIDEGHMRHAEAVEHGIFRTASGVRLFGRINGREK